MNRVSAIALLMVLAAACELATESTPRTEAEDDPLLCVDCDRPFDVLCERTADCIVVPLADPCFECPTIVIASHEKDRAAAVIEAAQAECAVVMPCPEEQRICVQPLCDSGVCVMGHERAQEICQQT